MTATQLTLLDPQQPPLRLLQRAQQLCHDRPDLYSRSRWVYLQEHDGTAWMIENPYHREERCASGGS